MVAALSTAATAASLQTVQYTNDASFVSALGAGGDKAVAEFRWGNNANNGDWEVGVGFPTSSPGNFNQANTVWSGNESFKLTYDGAGGLTLDFNGTSSFLSHAVDPQGFNALAVRANGTRGDVTISNLEFNGMGFGPLVADDVISYIALTNLDLDSMWMLTGNINFNPVSDGSSANRGSAPGFQVKLADLPVSDVPLPAAVWSLLAALTGLGLIGRRRRATA